MAQKPDKTTVQVEKLQERGGLQATVNSGGMYSYDEARPAYVERPDDLRSNPWMQLSSALQDFDAPLGDYIKKKQEDEMEYGIAQAGDIFKQYGTDPTTGNKLAWKEVIEKHPELAGKNPWLEKGYESARLQALGLDFKAQLQDAYTQSGLINERDVNKIGQFVDKFEQDFRKAQGLHEYPDKVTLGETFSKAAYEAKNGIFNRHVEDMERQNLARTREQYGSLMSKELAGIIDDPNINLSDPNTMDTVVVPRLIASAQRIAQEASLHGLPTHEAKDMVFKALAAEATERGYKDGGDDLLEVIAELDFGQGRLGDDPTIKDWISKTETQFTNQQKADENQKRIEEERAEADNYKAALDRAAVLADKGQNVTLEMVKGWGVRPQYWDNVMSSADALRKAKEESSDVKMSGPVMGAYLQALEDISKGRKGSDWVMKNYGQFPRSYAEKLMNVALSEDKSADAEMSTAMNSSVGRVWKQITKTDPEDMDMLSGAAAAAGTNPLLQRGYEAVENYMVEFNARYDDLKEKKGRNLSQYEISKLSREVERDILKEQPDTDPQKGKPDASKVGGPGVNTPDPVLHLPPVVAKQPLFGTQQEFREALREYKDAPTPEAKSATRVGQQLTSLNLDPAAGWPFVNLQAGLYAQEAPNTMSSEEWWSKAREKVWEKIKANGVHPTVLYGKALGTVGEAYAKGAKKLLGANQGNIKGVMKDTINR